MTLSAHSSKSQFSLKALMAATRKPDWCSDVRWRMEMIRRRESGMGRPRKSLNQETKPKEKEKTNE